MPVVQQLQDFGEVVGAGELLEQLLQFLAELLFAVFEGLDLGLYGGEVLVEGRQVGRGVWGMGEQIGARHRQLAGLIYF
jgi:hypothetical protein